MIFGVNFKQEVYEASLGTIDTNSKHKYLTLAYRLLKGGKPVNVVQKKCGEYAKKLFGSADAWAYMNLKDMYSVITIADVDIDAAKFAAKSVVLECLHEYACFEFEKAKDKVILMEKYLTGYNQLSHDFKTPINIIHTSVQLLKMKLLKEKTVNFEADYKQLLEFADENASKLSRLTTNLLDCVRAENGAMELMLGYESFAECVENICEKMRNFAEYYKIIIKTKSQLLANSKYIFDSGKIERITLNLISNSMSAIKTAGNANGIIKVETYENNEFLFIKVTDNGIGIAKEDEDKIFNSFYTKNSSGGSGLGLTVSKAMAELHSGYITYNRLKSGSCFTVAISKNIQTDKADSLYSRSSLYKASSINDYITNEIAVLLSVMQNS